MDRLLVLASGSAGRRQVLAKFGVEFKVERSNVSEAVPSGLAPEVVVTVLARRKARAVASLPGYGTSIVIGCDTVVALDGQVFGKPSTAEHAKSVLRTLCGRTHRVVSGVAVIDGPSGREAADFDASLVTMRSYSDDDIDAYIATGEPFDKAGSYALQGKGGELVARYEGSYDTIMGLPLAVLKKLCDSMDLWRSDCDAGKLDL